MSDTFGNLALPTEPPAPEQPAGDPALVRLLAFTRAAISASCESAWAAVATSREPVVRTAHAYDPESVHFAEKDLPALFGFRPRQTFATEGAPLDFLTSSSSVSLLWIPAPTTQLRDTLRATIVNAIAKAVAVALQRGRIPSWVDDGDTDPKAASLPEDVDAIKTSVPSSTSPQSYAGAALNGVIGTSVMSPRRGLAIKRKSAPGAYGVSPIVVTYVDWMGVERTMSVTPPNANGGDTLRPVDDEMAAVVQIDVPAQVTTAGAFEFGVQARAGRGSSLVARANLLRVPRLTQALMRQVRIPVFDQGRQVGVRIYQALEMQVELREAFAVDPEVQFLPISTTPGEVSVEVAEQFADGDVIQRFGFPDNGME